MQLTTVVALFASLAAAAPAPEPAAELVARDGPCPSGVTNDVPQCCGTGILNVVYVDCKTPTQAPSATNQLSAICARVGLQAKCCTVGIAGVGVVCVDPIPQ